MRYILNFYDSAPLHIILDNIKVFIINFVIILYIIYFFWSCPLLSRILDPMSFYNIIKHVVFGLSGWIFAHTITSLFISYTCSCCRFSKEKKTLFQFVLDHD